MDSPRYFFLPLETWRMNLAWNRGKLLGIPRNIVQCQPFCLLTCLKCLGCLHPAVIIVLRFRFFLDRKSTVTVPMVVTHLQSLEEMFSPKPQGFCDANDDHLGGSEINDLVVGWFVKGLFFWKNRSPCFIISGDFGAKKPSRPTKETPQKRGEKERHTLRSARFLNPWWCKFDPGQVSLGVGGRQ